MLFTFLKFQIITDMLALARCEFHRQASEHGFLLSFLLHFCEYFHGEVDIAVAGVAWTDFHKDAVQFAAVAC